MSLVADDIDLRIEKCRRILKNDSESQIFASLADCYRRKGDIEEAFRICSIGLLSHPDYGAGHLVMAKIHFDMGNFEESLVESQRAKALKGATTASEILECKILTKLGSYNDARVIHTRLLSNDPTNQELPVIVAMLTESKTGKEVLTGAATDINNTNKVADKVIETTLTIALLVKHLAGMSQVCWVMAVKYDGEVIARAPDSISNESIVNIIGLSGTEFTGLTLKAGLGKFRSCYVEAPGRKITIKDAGRFYLMMEVEEKMNIGLFNLQLSKLLAKLDYRGA